MLHPKAAPRPLPQARLDAMALALESEPDFIALPRLDPMGPAEHARALISDISTRLRRACAHLNDDEFEALVVDMVRTRLRFARLERDWAGGVRLKR